MHSKIRWFLWVFFSLGCLVVAASPVEVLSDQSKSVRALEVSGREVVIEDYGAPLVIESVLVAQKDGYDFLTPVLWNRSTATVDVWVIEMQQGSSEASGRSQIGTMAIGATEEGSRRPIAVGEIRQLFSPFGVPNDTSSPLVLRVAAVSGPDLGLLGTPSGIATVVEHWREARVRLQELLDWLVTGSAEKRSPTPPAFGEEPLPVAPGETQEVRRARNFEELRLRTQQDLDRLLDRMASAGLLEDTPETDD